jgi:beta-xylosidase
MLIGNAINRSGQLSLSKAITSAFGLDDGNTMVGTAGLWAPTIRHHRGTFYIVCTNCTLNSEGDDFETANFYVTSKDIWSDSWSDPVEFEFNGIDPSIFFDDDDRAYIQGSWRLDRTKQPSCTIKQLEIDITTGNPLSETKEIWEGFAKRDSEGPHIYKKDGWYYLVIAEGGTFEYHMLSVARSKNIWGPYESYEKNPILTAYGSDELVQNTGHGELFQDGYGAWWAAVLGVRHNGGRTPLGRETFLTPVTWPVGGWPQIGHPQLCFHRTNSPPVKILTIKQLPHVDDVYIRDPIMQDYQFSSDNSSISLRANDTDLSSPEGAVSFLGKRQRAIDETASAVLELEKVNIGKSLRVRYCLVQRTLTNRKVVHCNF